MLLPVLFVDAVDIDSAEGEADVDDDEDEEKDQHVDYHVCHTRKNIHILLQYMYSSGCASSCFNLNVTFGQGMWDTQTLHFA